MNVWISAGIGLFVVMLVVATSNSLVAQKNQVASGWSQIDVQLKRRRDLIPDLVSAVKGYLARERAVLERVTHARSAAIAAGSDGAVRAEAENTLSHAVHSVFAVAETYPELRSSQNVLALQEELASTENLAAFARQFYHDVVVAYNTRTQTFPSNLIAGMFGFAPQPLFQLDGVQQRAVPEIRLS